MNIEVGVCLIGISAFAILGHMFYTDKRDKKKKIKYDEARERNWDDYFTERNFVINKKEK